MDDEPFAHLERPVDQRRGPVAGANGLGVEDRRSGAGNAGRKRETLHQGRDIHDALHQNGAVPGGRDPLRVEAHQPVVV